MAGLTRVLAFDFGASSGRAMLGTFDGSKITLEEIHRFSNDPVSLNGTLYWDVYRLFSEIRQGIAKAAAAGEFESIGIDTWGVDFGLLRKDGSLVECPVHYRDARTKNIIPEAFEKIGRAEFYGITGIQFMELNTAFQLYSLVSRRKEILDEADTMLLMPDLFNFFLTGVKKTEYSIATTTQLLDAKTRTWSKRVFEALGIPLRLMAEIVPTGTVLGKLRQEICEELSCPSVNVIAVAGHDTQSAAVSVPSSSGDFIFISCGTWSLIGTETDCPMLDETTASLNVTNEGGFGGRITLLKNIVGLWLVQECRRQWKQEGRDLSFTDLADMALSAEPMKNFIDPDDPDFLSPGNMPRRIREYCRRTGQQVPESVSEIMRCVYQSLALKHRWALAQIETCTGKHYSSIHIVGGGVHDSLLCQFTANACGRPVVAGPVEATVIGNIAVQMMTLGAIPDIAEARKVIADSSPLAVYKSEKGSAWDKAFGVFLSVCGIMF